MSIIHIEVVTHNSKHHISIFRNAYPTTCFIHPQIFVLNISVSDLIHVLLFIFQYTYNFSISNILRTKLALRNNIINII